MARRRAPDYAEQVERLLDQAVALPHGPTRVELCEEAARLADLHNDPALGYRAREELVDAACFGGRPDVLIVSFAWCLAMLDRDAEHTIPRYHVLWRMKWVVGALPKFPEIELATIRGMLDDMERRFRDYGSVQPVVGSRRNVSLQTGDLEAAKEYHRQFVRMPRSILSDCHACELDALADFLVDTGRTALGVRKAEALLSSGMRCAKVPDTTYGDILLPMVRLGRAADAMAYHKKGYPLIRRSAGDIVRWGQHMAFLALTENDGRAAKLLENHLPDVEASHDPLATLSFFRNALLTLECLADRKSKMRLRLPAGTPLANESGEYLLADLADTVRARVLEMSRRFDRRNGNNYYEQLVVRSSSLKKKAVKVSYAG